MRSRAQRSIDDPSTTTPPGSSRDPELDSGFGEPDTTPDSIFPTPVLTRLPRGWTTQHGTCCVPGYGTSALFGTGRR